MRFHGLLILRDEGDFVAECISHLLSWCDTLFVYDTGSLDDTWDLLNDLARADARITLLGRQPVLYMDALRPWLFNSVRARFRHGDWIARLDADEVHHIPPPRFVSERLARHETRVHCQMYEFVLTRAELAGWAGEEARMGGRGGRPVCERRRRYYVDPWPELRLFRYRRSMRWPPGRYEPEDCGLLARARLPIRHYRCRSPGQIMRRCVLRSFMDRTRRTPFAHWKVEDWMYWVWEDDRPELRLWEPGTDLPPVRDESHLPPPEELERQRRYYARGWPRWYDRRRRHWREYLYRPLAMTARQQEELAAQMAELDRTARAGWAGPLPGLEGTRPSP